MPRTITRISRMPLTPAEVAYFGEGSRAAIIHTNEGRIRAIIHPRGQKDSPGLPSSAHLYVDYETGQCFESLGTLARETWIHGI